VTKDFKRGVFNGAWKADEDLLAGEKEQANGACACGYYGDDGGVRTNLCPA